VRRREVGWEAEKREEGQRGEKVSVRSKEHSRGTETVSGARTTRASDDDSMTRSSEAMADAMPRQLSGDDDVRHQQGAQAKSGMVCGRLVEWSTAGTATVRRMEDDQRG
jgi:hypothetical protein